MNTTSTTKLRRLMYLFATLCRDAKKKIFYVDPRLHTCTNTPGSSPLCSFSFRYSSCTVTSAADRLKHCASGYSIWTQNSGSYRHYFGQCPLKNKMASFSAAVKLDMCVKCSQYCFTLHRLHR